MKHEQKVEKGFKESIKNINNPFVAFEHRDFLIYWLTMFVSLIGTWMQNVAQPWLAYSLTQSPLKLGIVGALQFAPMMFFSLFAGALIDKFSRRKIIFITQISSMVVVLILAFLVWGGHIRYWHILVVSGVMGFINTVDMPARQTFVIELVGKKHLMNAIALNSTVFNIARVIGPAVAGLLMAYAGVAACFFVNAFSFGAVVIAMIFIKPNESKHITSSSSNMKSEIYAGLKYIYNNKSILKTLLTTAIVGTFAINYSVLVPVYAKQFLGTGEAGFGFLMSFLGVGAFVGALIIAVQSKGGPKWFSLNVVPVVLGIVLILFSLANGFVVAGLMLAVCGLAFAIFNSSANSYVQLNTTDILRGRVMSVYTLAFGGFTPIGSLYAGIITDYFGPRIGFVACGGMAVLLLVILNFCLRGKGGDA